MATQNIQRTAGITEWKATVTARAGGFTAPVLRLYQSPFVPTGDSTLAEFDAAEADFTGYAEVALGTFTTAGQDSGGGAVSYSDQLIFQATGGAVANTVNGAYMVSDPAGTPILVEWFPFDMAVGFDGAGDTMQATVELREPQPDTLAVVF